MSGSFMRKVTMTTGIIRVRSSSLIAPNTRAKEASNADNKYPGPHKGKLISYFGYRMGDMRTSRLKTIISNLCWYSVAVLCLLHFNSMVIGPTRS